MIPRCHLLGYCFSNVSSVSSPVISVIFLCTLERPANEPTATIATGTSADTVDALADDD